jgi:hypothetical protein
MGEQVHVNHTGCEAGEDKKRRLYIKRTDKGLVAYCHHCNDKGFASDTSSRLSEWLHKDTKTHTTGYTAKFGPISPKGKLWLHKHHCDAADVYFKGVVGQLDQVSLTLYDPYWNPIGWQIRNLVKEPKYLTKITDTRADAAWFVKDHKTLVITEDYLSAYRVHNDTGLSSLALLRTTITDKTLIQIQELGFNTIFIWLDPDEAGRKGAKKVQETLSHYLSDEVDVINHFSDQEPKQHTKKELHGLFSSISMC